MPVMPVTISRSPMELHCDSKNLKSHIPHICHDQIDFFYKTDYLSFALFYIWVKSELIWMSFSPPNEKKLMFSETFPIVTPIVLQKPVQHLKIQAINYFLVILLSMITIHHCAEDQLAWLDAVQIRIPYCTACCAGLLLAHAEGFGLRPGPWVMDGKSFPFVVKPSKVDQ